MEHFRSIIEDYFEKIWDEMMEVNHFIYHHPEVSTKEVLASHCLTEVLSDHGFDVKQPVAGLDTAFVASIQKGSQRPHVAFMCEYDALPDLGHGCGHNLIAVSSLAAGLAVSRLLEEVIGKVSVLGTPSEERPEFSGKKALIDAGLLNGMDFLMCAHPFDKTILGERYLAVNDLKVKFTGRSAHSAAVPFLGINASDAVQLTLIGINFLRQQLRPDVRIHWGNIEISGTVNVIPDTASVNIFFRASDMEYVKELNQKLINCIKGAALMTGCRVRYELNEGYQPFKLNRTLDNLMAANMKSVGMVFDKPPTYGMSGSTDSGNASQVVPGTHPMFKITENAVLHSREFTEVAGSNQAFEAAMMMAKAMALTAARCLVDPVFLQQVWDDFTAN